MDTVDAGIEEHHDVLSNYLTTQEREQVLRIVRELDDDEHYSIIINCADLYDFNIQLVETLLKEPYKVLETMDTAAIAAQRQVMQEFTDSQMNYMSCKSNCHMRVMGLMNCPELVRSRLPRSCDVGKFLSVTGTIIRSSMLKVLEYERVYICSKCKQVMSVAADFNQYYTITKPSKCSKDGCKSNSFTATNDADGQPKKCRNYQEIKIQEQIYTLPVGSVPRSMWVVLENDMVDCCKSGDDIVVTGVVEQRWKNLTLSDRCDIELVMRANNVQVINEQSSKRLVTDELRTEFDDFWETYRHRPFTGRNMVLASICPQVYGLYAVKLAVCLSMIGGLQRLDESGTQVRGEIHLLLVGDPGTGKSQFMKYATKVIPRSVFTTGIGSTSAGLTVTALRDSGEWQLEAGALVLADGGICCIDEFSSIREQDKTSIHEAMEQQTISVAKAGMVCKLNTRCTILAATNPKGKYDTSQDVSVNIALASPLLSRFDIVLVLLDNQNEKWDKIVSDYVLLGKHPLDAKLPKNLWTLQKIQAYISHAKTLKPTLTHEASLVLQAYYKAQRNADTRNAARTTIRLLQSLIRLAQAHCRLMYREVVRVEDAINAIIIIESSMQSAALLGGINALHTAFPRDAEEEYLMQADIILKTLKLDKLREAEIKYVNELKRRHKDSSAAQEPERLTQLREQPRSRNQTNKSPSEMLTDAQQAPDSDVRHKNKASDRLVIDTSRTHIQPSAGKTRGDTSSSMLKRTAEVLSAEPRRKKSVTISPHQSPPFAASPPFDIRNIISSTQMSGKTVNENKLKTSVKTKNLLKRFALPGESQTPSNRKKKENHSNTPATNPLNSISRIIGLSKICEITDDDLELD